MVLSARSSTSWLVLLLGMGIVGVSSTVMNVV